MNIEDAPTSSRSKIQHDLVSRILPILALWDPEGIGSVEDPGDSGAPGGLCDSTGLEYEREAECIAGSVYKIHTVAAATQVICDVFNDTFGPLFGLKPGVPPGPNEGYRIEGYDGERIQLAGKAVYGAVLDHRAWYDEVMAERRAASKAHVVEMFKKRGWIVEGEDIDLPGAGQVDDWDDHVKHIRTTEEIEPVAPVEQVERFSLDELRTRFTSLRAKLQF
jgi:hypothetical protein